MVSPANAIGGAQCLKTKISPTISNLMIETMHKFDASVAEIRGASYEAEFLAYRRVVGKVLGDVMNPIYVRHPDLKPAGLD
jgi:hypothetical protein